jgi:hypothetical protein
MQHSLEGTAYLNRVHCSSLGCSGAQEGAKLNKMQCSSLGCSLAQWKDKRPWRPEFGPEGKQFVSENSLFFIFGGAAKLRWGGGRAAPVWRIYEAKKTGARSARARTRGQNPLVVNILFVFSCYLRKIILRILQDGDEGLNKKILANPPTKAWYHQV